MKHTMDTTPPRDKPTPATEKGTAGLPEFKKGAFARLTEILNNKAKKQELLGKNEDQIREFLNEYNTADCFLVLIMKLNAEELYGFLNKIPVEILKEKFNDRNLKGGAIEALAKKIGEERTLELATRSNSYQNVVENKPKELQPAEPEKPISLGEPEINDQDLRDIRKFDDTQELKIVPPSDETQETPIVVPGMEDSMTENDPEHKKAGELIGEISKLGFSFKHLALQRGRPHNSVETQEIVLDLKILKVLIKNVDKFIDHSTLPGVEVDRFMVSKGGYELVPLPKEIEASDETMASLKKQVAAFRDKEVAERFNDYIGLGLDTKGKKLYLEYLESKEE